MFSALAEGLRVTVVVVSTISEGWLAGWLAVLRCLRWKGCGLSILRMCVSAPPLSPKAEACRGHRRFSGRFPLVRETLNRGVAQGVCVPFGRVSENHRRWS